MSYYGVPILPDIALSSNDLSSESLLDEGTIVTRGDGDTNFMRVLASMRVLSQDLGSSLEMLTPLFEAIGRN